MFGRLFSAVHRRSRGGEATPGRHTPARASLADIAPTTSAVVAFIESADDAGGGRGFRGES